MSAERAAGEEEDFDEGEEEESKSRVSGLDSATGEVSAPTVRHDKKGKACNTGPKGVLADYADAKLAMRARRIRERVERERVYNSMAVGDPLSGLDPAAAAEPAPEDVEPDLAEELDEDELRIMEEYKQKRMLQLQQEIMQFGSVRELTCKNMPEVVDSVPGYTFCVLHLYQPYVEPCVRLNFALDAIAPKYPYVSFCKMIATLAIPDFDERGLPAVLIFRGGKQIKTLIRIISDLGNTFTDLQVVKWLAKLGVLKDPQAEFEKRAAERQKHSQEEEAAADHFGDQD